MKLNVAICDDELSDIAVTEKYLEKYHFETGVEFQIQSFTNPDALLKNYTAPGTFNLLFLDMEMPIAGEMKKGIEIAKQLRALPDPDLRIVFISNYPEYMNLGYDVQASHYLTKDVSFEKFSQVLSEIIRSLSHDAAIIRIKTGREDWTLLRVQDILFISSVPGKRDQITYHSINQTLKEHRSILSAGNTLKQSGFAFANKQHLVNLRHVRKYTNNHLVLDNGKELELSRYYKKEFLELFSTEILTLSR